MPSFTVNPAAARENPEEGQAALTRAQFHYFNERVRPVENSALNDIRRPQRPAQIARHARHGARASFNDLKGIEERTVGTYGVQLNDDERRTIDRRFGLERALAGAGAYNTAYNSTLDTQLNAAGDALHIGRGIAGQAAQGLGAAANDYAAARNAAEAQAAQNVSNRISTVATGAGVGFAAGGIPGAAIGGGIGLLASLF